MQLQKLIEAEIKRDRVKEYDGIFIAVTWGYGGTGRHKWFKPIWLL